VRAALCAAGTDVPLLRLMFGVSNNTVAGDPVHAGAGKGTHKADGDREVSAAHTSTETTCEGAQLVCRCRPGSCGTRAW
jgi:hypothetical protein